MIQNHQDLVTNERVIHIISHYEFFVHLKVLYFILFPLKKQYQH